MHNKVTHTHSNSYINTLWCADIKRHKDIPCTHKTNMYMQKQSYYTDTNRLEHTDTDIIKQTCIHINRHHIIQIETNMHTQKRTSYYTEKYRQKQKLYRQKPTCTYRNRHHIIQKGTCTHKNRHHIIQKNTDRNRNYLDRNRHAHTETDIILCRQKRTCTHTKTDIIWYRKIQTETEIIQTETDIIISSYTDRNRNYTDRNRHAHTKTDIIGYKQKQTKYTLQRQKQTNYNIPYRQKQILIISSYTRQNTHYKDRSRQTIIYHIDRSRYRSYQVTQTETGVT